MWGEAARSTGIGFLATLAYVILPQAIRLAIETESLLLDPVYTGKAMKGLIDLARKGEFRGETVVFLHTGGAQGLFGYQSVMDGKL